MFLIHLKLRSSSFRLHQIFPILMIQILLPQIQQAPGPKFRKIGKSLFFRTLEGITWRCSQKDKSILNALPDFKNLKTLCNICLVDSSFHKRFPCKIETHMFKFLSYFCLKPVQSMEASSALHHTSRHYYKIIELVNKILVHNTF